MLFLAVQYFKYEGSFDMYIFDETETVTDPIRGKIAIGGYTKRHWLRWSELVALALNDDSVLPKSFVFKLVPIRAQIIFRMHNGSYLNLPFVSIGD